MTNIANVSVTNTFNEWLIKTNQIKELANSAFRKANTIINVKDFGAVGDGSTDDTAAVQNAINNAVATQSSLYIPEGRYLITRDLTTPTAVNGQFGFEIRGDGKEWQSTLMFSGANVKEGLVIYDPVRTSSAYIWWGKFKDFGMYFSSGANGGFQIRYASHPTVDSIMLNGATKGLIIDNCNKPLVTDSLIISSGNTTFPQVTINRCTVLGFISNYLGGSANATGIKSKAGLEIDRSSTATIMNNAIETCGPLIRIACNSPNDAYRCDEITLIGNNLENTTNQYVEVGTGWTSGFSTFNLVSIGNHGSISGSTTVKNGYKINRISGFYSKGDSLAINTGLTNAASFFFETEAASIGTVIEQARTEYGNPAPWVSYGGVTANSATPYARYSDLENSNLRTNKTVFANNTTDSGIIDNSLFMPQGGLIRTMFVSANTPAEGVIKALKYTPLNGDLFTILATGSNVSIDHAASGTPAGSARFYTQDEKRLNLAPSQSITFIYNASNGLLVQLTSALTRSPQIVANTITANTLSMTNMTVSNTVTSTRFQAGATAGVSNASVTALMTSLGNLGNCFEWGHTNPNGYRAVLGNYVSSGLPFIGFQCEAGTTTNTFRTRGLPGFVIASDTTGRLNFSTVPTASADNQTPTHVAVIDQNGNVAIGATTSAYKLRVVGAANNTSLEGNTIIAHQSSASTLGVGTATPNNLSKIHIVGTSLAEGNFHIGDSQRGFWIDPINVFTYGMAKSAAGSSASLFLYSNGVKATIQATGNVGIGTTSPTALLDVNSTTMRLRTSRTPASNTAAGEPGEICWDSNYIYVCTATNTWRRANLTHAW